MKNAQLWKRILNEGVDVEGDQSAKTKLVNSICTATIIVCPSFMKNEGDFKKRHIEEYPKLAIPFEKFWLERHMGDHLGNALLQGIHVAVTREEKWDTLTCCEIMSPMGQRPRVVVAWQFRLSKDGSMFTQSPDGDSKIAIYPMFARESLGEDKANREIVTATFDFCDMLSLLSCKNISLSDRKLGLGPREERQAHKRGVDGDYRYHVLVVRPAGAKSDSPGVEIDTMPRHVCRGHFAEYGPEFGKGLLFGRLAGRFYIPPHMKGDKKNGEVAKDYEVRTA